MARLDELQAEYHELIHSWEFAYAMGATRTMGPPDPRLDHVLRRADELRREMAALREAEGSEEP
jgi:hypothetical protein